ncbi:recombinase family protein [Agromyces sp. NBRC 114283]|uniref:recombinase family protein n=1 Tax=Agromyces sp. NBRC 114283 TaxID=2994521 RepID=UPI0024A4D22F|nr:recombinase family protein [Agromyces sp. NBRC 114283]GLU91301.1 hypothetical protein Agsp01_35560 [Agromyces sp. NBRC 114283]
MIKPQGARARARAVLYLRQSVHRDESISIEMQEQAGRDYCERMGYDIVEVHSDPGYSGRRWDNRPAVQEVMFAVEAGRADVVVLWKWSRLARNRLHFALAAERVESAGGRIESATEPLDTTTASGRFARGMMTEYAAFQSEQIGEQWREVREHRRRAGLPPTGGPRFGYRREGDAYSPDPEIAPILVDLYKRYLSGAGAAQLTRRLNELGIPSARGSRWTYQSTLGMLDTGFAAGLIGRARSARRVWEREFTRGAHEAIVDGELWDAYVAARAKRHRVPAREAGKYLLTGMLRCGDCGGRMHGHQYPVGPTYVCSRSTVTDGHRKVSIVAWRAEKAVEDWALALADEVAAQADARAALHVKLTKTGTRRSYLRREIEKANDRLATLTVRHLDGVVTAEAYKVAAERIESERNAATRQLQILAENPTSIAALSELPGDLRAQWPRLSNAQRQHVLRPLIAWVEVAPASARGARKEQRVTVRPAWTELEENDG